MVEIYTKTNCPSCIQFKKKLEKEDIEFEEKNVDNNEDAYMDMIMLGKPGVVFPVIRLQDAYYYNLSDDEMIEKINGIK